MATVAEWYRYRPWLALSRVRSPVPLKTRRVGQRCTLNLSRAETSSRWCGMEHEGCWKELLNSELRENEGEAEFENATLRISTLHIRKDFKPQVIITLRNPTPQSLSSRCRISASGSLLNKRNMTCKPQEIGITQECGCVEVQRRTLWPAAGCVLARTVESNQGGRFDGNESVADSFRSGAVSFKSMYMPFLEAFPSYV
ncbi:hypothetical protein TNCV_3499881 [Trichonephila clavipes]|nr:hypothetical protein TNCV_3499881 [Trichonephila clavipes]